MPQRSAGVAKTRRLQACRISCRTCAKQLQRRHPFATTTKRRVRRPLHHGSLATRAPVVPLPRFAGAEKIAISRRLRARVLPKPRSRKAKRTKSHARVERREAPGSWATPRGRMLPPAHASGVARATEQSACANRLLRARCASRRSTTIAVLRRGCRPPPPESRLSLLPAGTTGWRPYRAK
jgi:hypothetical protein